MFDCDRDNGKREAESGDSFANFGGAASAVTRAPEPGRRGGVIAAVERSRNVRAVRRDARFGVVVRCRTSGKCQRVRRR